MISCQKVSDSHFDSLKIPAISANKYHQPEPIVKLCGTFFLHSLGNIEWRIHRGLLDSMIKLSWSTNGKKVHVRYSSLFREKSRLVSSYNNAPIVLSRVYLSYDFFVRSGG